MGEKSFLKLIGTSGDKRLRFKIRTQRGKVTELVVQLEFDLDGGWKPVVRYDNAHDFPHRDILDPAGNSVEKKSLQLSSFEEVLEYAEQDITDRVDWYIDEFMKRRRLQ